MLGEDGSLAYDGTDWHREVADRVEVVNTVGAGDSYVAGFAKVNPLTMVKRTAIPCLVGYVTMLITVSIMV